MDQIWNFFMFRIALNNWDTWPVLSIFLFWSKHKNMAIFYCKAKTFSLRMGSLMQIMCHISYKKTLFLRFPVPVSLSSPQNKCTYEVIWVQNLPKCLGTFLPVAGPILNFPPILRKIISLYLISQTLNWIFINEKVIISWINFLLIHSNN